MSQPLPPPPHTPTSPAPQRHNWRRGAAVAGIAAGIGVGYFFAQGPANAATTTPTYEPAAAVAPQAPQDPATPVLPSDPQQDPNSAGSSGGGWTAPQPGPAQGGVPQGGGWQGGNGPSSSGS